MIKVLEHGASHHINRCPSCGCKFEWDERNADVCEGFANNALTIYCPECGLTRPIEVWKGNEE